MIADHSPLSGRRIQIAGSASKTTDTATIFYAHRVVDHVVRDVLKQGGGLVLAVGREPRATEGNDDSPSLLFDWSALSAVAEVLRGGLVRWPASAGAPVVVVASEKAEAEIPSARQALWRQLLEQGW